MANAPVEMHQDPLRQVLEECKLGLIGVGFFSLVMNVLLLTGPFYMLQIYDRVLPSQSLPTLLVLSVLAAGLMGIYGALDFLRSRLMGRIGTFLDLRLAGPAFDLGMDTGSKAGVGGDPTRDLRTVRQYLVGPAAVGLFDIPWLPVYLAVVFLLHHVLGWMAVIAALLLITLAVLNAAASKGPVRAAIAREFKEDAFVAACRRNAETLRILGMRLDLGRIWLTEHARLLKDSQTGSDRNALYSSLSRALRLLAQSAVLGVGAFLVVDNSLSAGALIAASITFARALAPVDLAIGQWRGVVAARQSWQRLQSYLSCSSRPVSRVALGRPHQTFSAASLSVASPDRGSIIVEGVSFQLRAGDGLGVIGASGCGKSTLVRGLLGAWPAVQGEVRLDGATFDQWREEDLGAHIGYLPQDVHLFNGTIAQNIARFRHDATADAVIAAARLAGVHQLILSLPDGYETVIGAGGLALSAGQRQRVALARAVYGTPFLVVLDEPNAHVDGEGEFALINAIRALRAAGSIVVVVAHRKGVISDLNKLLLLNAGRVQCVGDTNIVMAHIASKSVARPGGLSVVAS
jgi:ATP-binding cassette subfamily C protein PrsD